MKKMKPFLLGAGMALVMFALVSIISIVVHMIPFSTTGMIVTLAVLFAITALMYAFDFKKG